MKHKSVLLEGVANAAVLLSAGVAVIGVSGVIGWSTPLTIAGSGILLGATILTELAASRLPVEAQKRWAEGGRMKACFVGLGFAALTAWNVTAGHMGMEAINRDSVAAQRAPLERAFIDARAASDAADKLLADYDAETQRRAAARLQVIMGADGRYVTQRGRETERAERAADEREAGRAPLVEGAADKDAAEARARLELENAPAGRPQHELWGLAIILELLKGALLWFAAPVSGRRGNGAEIIPIEPAAYAAMDEAELQRILSHGRTISALAQHALKRRTRAA